MLSRAFLFKKMDAAFYAAGAALLASGAGYLALNGCVYVEESVSLLNHYLSDGGALWKIFYLPGTEGPGYVFRARELSYFFNYLDAQLIKLSFMAGLPHFLSATYFCSLLALGALHFRYARLFFGEDGRGRAVLLLLWLVFLSSPQLLFSGQYFRTGKVLAACLLAWQGWLLLSLAYGKSACSARAFSLTYFAVMTMAGLADEQGLFLTVAMSGLLLPLLRAGRGDKALKTVYAAGASVAILLFYRVIAGQYLVRALTGVPAGRFDPEFQAGSQVSLSHVLGDAAGLLLKYASLLLGGAGPLLLSAVLAAVFGLLAYGAVKRRPAGQAEGAALRYAPPAVLLYWLIMLLGMLFLMLLSDSRDPRFGFTAPYAAVPFLQLWYYPLPVTGVLLVLLSAGAILLSRRAGGAAKTVLLSLLCLALVRNIYLFRSYHAVMRSHGIARPGVAQYLVAAASAGSPPPVIEGGDPLYSKNVSALVARLSGYAAGARAPK